MDSNELNSRTIQLVKECYIALLAKRRRQVDNPPAWQWAHLTLVFPESRCAYCDVVIRSNAIWLFQPPRVLIGQFKPRPGYVRLDYPAHPHLMLEDGTLCLGAATNILDWFASRANVRNLAQSVPYYVNWMDKYFDHYCRESERAADIYNGDDPDDEEDLT